MCARQYTINKRKRQILFFILGIYDNTPDTVAVRHKIPYNRWKQTGMKSCQDSRRKRMESAEGRSEQNVKLKNILIVVKDIEKSRQFYHDLFGLDTVLDQEGNMILTGGLVLQQETIWREFLGKDIIQKSNSCELYFEEPDIEEFAEKLKRLYPSVQYVHGLISQSWGQKVIRFYDPDGNLIEVGTPM